MKSMTIHKMDDQLVAAIQSLADEKGESLNAAIKDLLAKAVGFGSVSEIGSNQARAGYRRFLGRWSDDEAHAFSSAIADFGQIDESDWIP